MPVVSVSALLDWLIQLFLYPGLMFMVFMVIFTQWIARKVTARIQYRRGPCYTGPLGFLQPFADFMKLLMKEDVVSRYSLRLAPVLIASLGVGALTAMVLMTPLAYKPIYGSLDVILLFYLGLWSSLAILFLGIATPNPYTSLGVGRFLALLISSEPAFIASFLVPVIIASKHYGADYSIYRTSLVAAQLWTRSPADALAMLLALIAGFIAMMAVLEIKPFDFPEAEGEIYWGVFTEYGGPRLALAFFNLFMERIVIPIIFVILFLGGPYPFNPIDNYWLAAITILVKYLVVYIALLVIDNTMPRYRPDQAIRKLWKYSLTLSILALIAAIFA